MSCFQPQRINIWTLCYGSEPHDI